MLRSFRLPMSRILYVRRPQFTILRPCAEIRRAGTSRANTISASMRVALQRLSTQYTGSARNTRCAGSARHMAARRSIKADQTNGGLRAFPARNGIRYTVARLDDCHTSVCTNLGSTGCPPGLHRVAEAEGGGVGSVNAATRKAEVEGAVCLRLAGLFCTPIPGKCGPLPFSCSLSPGRRMSMCCKLIDQP